MDHRRPTGPAPRSVGPVAPRAEAFPTGPRSAISGDRLPARGGQWEDRLAPFDYHREGRYPRKKPCPRRVFANGSAGGVFGEFAGQPSVSRTNDSTSTQSNRSAMPPRQNVLSLSRNLERHQLVTVSSCGKMRGGHEPRIEVARLADISRDESSW